MASAAILSQVQGLLQQCISEYGDEDGRIQGILGEVESLMSEHESADAAQEAPAEDAMEAPADEAPSDFKSARMAAMKDGVMGRGKDKEKDNEQPKAEDEVQAEDDKKRRKSKAFG